MKNSEQDKIVQWFADRLGLAFSSDPDGECNRTSLQKLLEHVKSKRGAK